MKSPATPMKSLIIPTSRKACLFALLVFSTLNAVAQTEGLHYMTVQTQQATQSIELATVRKISFDVPRSLVIVTTSDGVQTFPQMEMQQIYFEATPTAIEQLPSSTITMSVKDGKLTVHRKGILRIYKSTGELCSIASVQPGSALSLQSLPQGVYIVQLGSETLKFTK